MHTVIVGLGVTGYSCLKFLAGRDRLTVVDTRERPPYLDAAQSEFRAVDYVCGNAATEDVVAAADRIVVSPGVSLEAPLLAAARARGIPMTSDIGLFCQHVTAPVIAVTGTNGKSTVTVLAGELLTGAGIDVAVGGNLGVPALDLLGCNAEVYLLELSSFQLERLAGGETFAVGCVLNVTPDHMDRYASLDDYARAKRRVYQGARVAVYNRADRLTQPEPGPALAVSVGLDRPAAGHWGIQEINGSGQLCLGDDPILPLAALRMQGRHNEFNALAAAALAAAVGADPKRFADVLTRFSGLEHRCELVAEHEGVRYINDSKATNAGATVAALEGLGDATQPRIVLIAGGDAKGADMSGLRAPVQRYVARAVLLGKDADLLAETLADLVPITRVATLPAAVCAAKRQARPGDIVLLSPACASLDMFANFEARGRAFAAAVARVAVP